MKLKILRDTMWYGAPGGQRALKSGEEVEIADPCLANSWIFHGVAEPVK